MAKKILSVLIAVLMVASLATMAIGTASAAAPSFSGGTVYWECPWSTARIAYCHVWGTDGSKLYDWQIKEEKMTKVEGKENTWSYEIPAGPYDEIIFSIDTGAQTYDLVLTDDNINDTAVTDTDTMIENPMDSNKTSAKTTWKSGKNGPHLGITSIGNLVGEVLAPTESGATMVASFIKNYISVNPDNVTADVLKNLIASANTTAEDVYAALESMPEFPTLPMSEEDSRLQIDVARELLGIGGGNNGGNNGCENNDNNSGDNNNGDATTNNGSNASTTSTSSNRSNTSTTSKTSSGTTTTGDSTPFVVLGIVLVAALGVAVVAAKKKVSE